MKLEIIRLRMNVIAGAVEGALNVLGERTVGFFLMN